MNTNRIVCKDCFKIIIDGSGFVVHSLCPQCELRRKLEEVISTLKISWEDVEETISKIKHDKEMEDFKKQFMEWRRQATQ